MYVEQPLEVFNLSITNTPSYFVGKDGLWVHNANIKCNDGADADGGKNAKGLIGKDFEDYLVKILERSESGLSVPYSRKE